uniref:Uncharacterized protein n=1 Tax=Sphenodon punctatus TaxID=8508 RepID=A0A8D0G8P2_SPHPU
MVVGLSAYAKHISSQLHKDKVDAHDGKEEDGKEVDEEYFDKELIQLIKQRNEQNRQGEACCMNQEIEPGDRRSQRRPDDRDAYQDRKAYDPSSWYHHGPSQRDWKWENDGFISSRQGKFPHSARNPNTSRHLNSSRGRAVWHQNGSGVPSNRYYSYGNSGGGWHPNEVAGTSNWHHAGRGRNPNWNSDGTGGFSSWQSKNCGGNWKSNQQGVNGWNFAGSGDPFLFGRNTNSQREDLNVPWLKKKSMQNQYNSERYTWQWKESDKTGIVPPYRDPTVERNDEMNDFLDFTSDKLPPDAALDFSASQQPESKTSKVNGKSGSASRDKINRWAPYPSQKAVEQQPLSEENASKNSERTDSLFLPSLQPSVNQTDHKTDVTSLPKLKKWKETLLGPSSYKATPDNRSSCKVAAGCPSRKEPDQDDSRRNRMPYLKSPLLVIQDIMKSSSKKQDSKSLLKNVKLLLSSSPGEYQNDSNAQDL